MLASVPAQPGYKLALLRVLGRAADGTIGLARETEEDHIAIPLGLVGLYWIRLFQPLLKANLPQNPQNRGLDRLGFVKDGFRALTHRSHLDFRVGSRFGPPHSSALHRAIRDACQTIVRMPVHFMTYPSGDSILKAHPNPRVSAPSDIRIDASYLSSFGELLIPRDIWRALGRFNVWIEPALTAEWTRLMMVYAKSQERTLNKTIVTNAMTWLDPDRDVRIAKERAKDLIANGTLNCVWSGRRLNHRNLDVDHCFPWSAWPCSDLWNLLPSHRHVNQNQKRNRLPGSEVLNAARECIQLWWDAAYRNADNPLLPNRFIIEAKASLPGLTDESANPDKIFEAVRMQRLRLKHDQQIPEWVGSGGSFGKIS